MFGATFLVPILTGFDTSTTLLFSGVGTLLFLTITRNRVPSYLGSSFAFLGPVGAAMAGPGMGAALFGIVFTGALLAVVGHLLALFAFLGWGILGGDWKHAMLVAIAVLIITCPDRKSTRLNSSH